MTPFGRKLSPWLRSEAAFQIRNWRQWPIRSAALIAIKVLGVVPVLLLFILCLNLVLVELGAPLLAPSYRKYDGYYDCSMVSVFFLLHQGFFALVTGVLVFWMFQLQSLATAILALLTSWITMDVYSMTHQGSRLIDPDFTTVHLLEPFCRSLWERWG